jgi:hypothetical protein
MDRIGPNDWPTLRKYGNFIAKSIADNPLESLKQAFGILRV